MEVGKNSPFSLQPQANQHHRSEARINTAVSIDFRNTVKYNTYNKHSCNSYSRICSAPPIQSPEGALHSQYAVRKRKRLQMAPECCCQRPHEFQFCRYAIPCTRCGDRKCMVTNLPLNSWLEEVAVAGGAQWRAWWNVGDQREQGLVHLFLRPHFRSKLRYYTRDFTVNIVASSAAYFEW